MQENRKRQISDLIQSQFPEFIRVDHPTLVAFIEAYYEWLQLSDRGGKLLSPMGLGDVLDVDSTLDDFLANFKQEYLFNFPEQLAVSRLTGRPVDPRKLIKNIKAFYQSKGTEKSYEFLFRVLYDSGLEFYYPNRDVLRLSDGKWYERNALKITNTLGGEVYKSVGNVVYQLDAAGKISASAKVLDVSLYQESLYEVAELGISARNGTFQTNKPVYFKVDGREFRESKIYSVVSTVTISNGGSDYLVGDDVIFTTASGDSGINARGKVSLVSSTGAIRKIKMESFGVYYQAAPTVSINSISGSGFSGTANIGSLCLSEGRYLNNDGILSSNKVIQDNHYYQQFSYVLKSEIVVDRYRETLRRLVHPVGTAMFGQVSIKRCSKEDISNSTSLIRYEIPIIGHYAPYTFKTYDNLEDWFKLVPEGATLAVPTGYDPIYHNAVIESGPIRGNPISNRYPYPILTGGITGPGGLYRTLSLPADSTPLLGIPFVSVPAFGNVDSEGYLKDCVSSNTKNSCPFWIIYEHPNRKITQPTLAQIWRNQIVDSVDFGWQWPEQCSVTGAFGATGWTADFYGDNPVDKKYTFLLYNTKSEFRKITARAFFEMPIGSSYDCRTEGVDLAEPIIAFVTPKTNQVLSGSSDVDIAIDIQNLSNNDSLPINHRIHKLRVYLDGNEVIADPELTIGKNGTPVQLESVIREVPKGIHWIRVVPFNQAGLPSPVIQPAEVTFVWNRL